MTVPPKATAPKKADAEGGSAERCQHWPDHLPLTLMTSCGHRNIYCINACVAAIGGPPPCCHHPLSLMPRNSMLFCCCAATCSSSPPPLALAAQGHHILGADWMLPFFSAGHSPATTREEANAQEKDAEGVSEMLLSLRSIG